jgi:hypothetical protein
MPLPIPPLAFQSRSGADGNMGGSTSVGLQNLITKSGISVNFGDGGSASAGLLSNNTLMLIGLGVLVWFMSKKHN